jgi:hypothetical protein
MFEDLTGCERLAFDINLSGLLFQTLYFEDHWPVAIRAAGNGDIGLLVDVKVAPAHHSHHLFAYVCPGPGAKALWRPKGKLDHKFLAVIEMFTRDQTLHYLCFHILVNYILVDSPLEYSYLALVHVETSLSQT